MGFRQTVRAIVDTGAISVPTVVDAALGRLDAETCDRRLEQWSTKLLHDAKIHLTVHGREHAGDGTESFVVMSNHQSLYDIPVLFRSLPGRIRMVAKSELFKVPVWGHAMAAAGFIRIDRADRDQAVESLRNAGTAHLGSGTHVWIAPEGTRSPSGRLGTFKSGGFRMALETGVRILPVAIDGTRNVLPARGAVVHTDQRVEVTVLPPVNPRDYGVDRRKELTEAVRTAIAGALGQHD
jgi:1-acyl-sn-glycerol-3-phosphate acyltransferase